MRRILPLLVLLAFIVVSVVGLAAQDSGDPPLTPHIIR